MANEEIKTFNVYNNSVRLIHIGGVQILPETVVSVIDDVGGINRADVDSCEFLEFTDQDETNEPKEAVKAKPKTAAKVTSATGASWSSKG